MRIAGVASAFPGNYYRQEVIREALKRDWVGKLEKPQLLDRLHASVGVNGRYLALPIEQYEQLDTWGKNNDAWIKCARVMVVKFHGTEIRQTRRARHGQSAERVYRSRGRASFGDNGMSARFNATRNQDRSSCNRGVTARDNGFG